MAFVGENLEPVGSGDLVAVQPAIVSEADNYYRRQAALVALGRKAAAPADVAVLIQDAAALIAETLEADHYGAAELDAAGTKLTQRLAATGGAGDGREQFIENQAKFDKQKSLAAYALQTAQVVVVPDLAKNPPVRDRFLVRQGIRSALVVPLQIVDQSFGALAAYHSRPREFAAEDLLFAETIAHLVSTTISRQRTQRALDDERRFTRTVLATVDALVLILDPKGRIMSINGAGERATGFVLHELVNRPVWNTLIVHDQLPMLQEAIERVSNLPGPAECEGLILTKLGERRRVRWNLAATRDAAGKVESIVGTGIDITDQRAAEAKVSQFEAAQQSLDTTGPAPAPAQFHALPAGVWKERRKRPRRSFNFLQRIAPIVEGNLPDRRQFHVVHCQDISSGGFSFSSVNPPVHTSYVVALGTPPVVIYLTAKVIHVTAVIHDDRTRYVVGCQYVGRANYPDKALVAIG